MIISDKVIPNEVFWAVQSIIGDHVNTNDIYRAIMAVIETWPNGSYDSLNPFGETKYIILPVPQENQ